MRAAILSRMFSAPRAAAPSRHRMEMWLAWMPLLLPAVVIASRSFLLPWQFMWLLAIAIFAACKWQTWWAARTNGRISANWKRSVRYLLFWPGMDAPKFFSVAQAKRQIRVALWLAASAKTLVGVLFVWLGARFIALDHPLLGGWTGMLGLVLFLHFGTFHLLALAWQRAGHPVQPIMRQPLASRSLSELWGKRWNLGFHTLSHRWIFEPLLKRFGPVPATLAAFLASGLLHDVVLSVPARGGYGLPTAYFLLQGFGVIAERSRLGKKLGLGAGSRGFAWTVLIALGPLYFLFHPWFVMRVMVPFLRAIAG